VKFLNFIINANFKTASVIEAKVRNRQIYNLEMAPLLLSLFSLLPEKIRDDKKRNTRETFVMVIMQKEVNIWDIL